MMDRDGPPTGVGVRRPRRIEVLLDQRVLDDAPTPVVSDALPGAGAARAGGRDGHHLQRHLHRQRSRGAVRLGGPMPWRVTDATWLAVESARIKDIILTPRHWRRAWTDQALKAALEDIGLVYSMTEIRLLNDELHRLGVVEDVG